MALATVFDEFADWCVESSPLYERLARGTAQDDALLELVESVPAGKSSPHLLLAGVHDLLLARAGTATSASVEESASGAGHELARFYPTIVDDPVGVTAALVENPDADPAGEDPFPPFRRFALAKADALRETFDRRRTQTNSVRRCAALLPTFEMVSRELDREPFVLIELGPSAGLNLRWDRYCYDYGHVVGPESPVTIESGLQGEREPPLPDDEFPAVVDRLGIDLNPLDVTDPADVRWLKALVWPDQTERHRVLDAACDLVRQDPPEIRQGDATALLPGVVEEFDDDAPVVVYDTQVRYQLSKEAEAAYSDAIREIGEDRRVHWLSGSDGVDGAEAIWMDHGRVENGDIEQERLLAYQQHGAWVRWVR